jgi:hypothetical protein
MERGAASVRAGQVHLAALLPSSCASPCAARSSGSTSVAVAAAEQVVERQPESWYAVTDDSTAWQLTRRCATGRGPPQPSAAEAKPPSCPGAAVAEAAVRDGPSSSAPSQGPSRRPAARTAARRRSPLADEPSSDWDCIQARCRGCSASASRLAANAASSMLLAAATPAASPANATSAAQCACGPASLWLDTLPRRPSCSSGTRTLSAPRHRWASRMTANAQAFSCYCGSCSAGDTDHAMVCDTSGAMTLHTTF